MILKQSLEFLFLLNDGDEIESSSVNLIRSNRHVCAERIFIQIRRIEMITMYRASNDFFFRSFVRSFVSILCLYKSSMMKSIDTSLADEINRKHISIEICRFMSNFQRIGMMISVQWLFIH